jgi:hypothetical protein
VLHAWSNDRSEVLPKSKYNEQFRHQKHWSKQQMRWIVNQRGLSSLEHSMPYDLRGHANPN